jgi:hypothetical protein
MKKLVVITLHDGTVVTRDITTLNIAPFGAPANAPEYAQYCAAMCQIGFTDYENTSEKQYTHIAPSNIKSVAVKIG